MSFGRFYTYINTNHFYYQDCVLNSSYWESCLSRPQMFYFCTPDQLKTENASEKETLLNVENNPELYFRRNKYVCSLAQAKQNLERYLVVGVTEMMKDTVAVFENVLPGFFDGASRIYNEGGSLHARSIGPCKKCETLSDEAQKMAERIYKDDIQFYEYAKKRFLKIAEKVVGTDAHKNLYLKS